MNILQLNASILGDNSVTRQLTDKVVANLAGDDDHVTHRDLVASPIPHLDAEILMAAGIEEAQRNDYQRQQLALNETLLEELFAADVLVIGAPMYNFTVPSQLKTWMDRVAQAGRTFQYTEQGAQGLLTGKRAYLVSGRGGIYSEGPAAAMDHQESLVKQFLAFIGITEISTIRAEGVNLGPEQREQSMQAAHEAVAQAFSAA